MPTGRPSPIYAMRYPNATLTFNTVSTAGEGITARYTITGTHTGPSLAFGPPTGKPVTLTGVMVAHTQNGQITELWDYADRFGLSLQLDQALPAPPTFVAVNKATRRPTPTTSIRRSLPKWRR